MTTSPCASPVIFNSVDQCTGSTICAWLPVAQNTKNTIRIVILRFISRFLILRLAKVALFFVKCAFFFTFAGLTKYALNMAPLFSIITVTYNAADTLPATLASVKEQTCGMYEYIVMDGVSTDRTLKLAIDAGIPRARIYSSPDKGLYDAMNKAMALATGQYLIFLNSGDAFHSPDTSSILPGLSPTTIFPASYMARLVWSTRRDVILPLVILSPRRSSLSIVLPRGWWYVIRHSWYCAR